MPISTDKPRVSVIIPCYNEERNLRRGVLDEVYGYMREQPYRWEVVLVNDESTDKSRDLLQSYVSDKPGFTLHDIAHGGKPAAVWAGIQRACGEIVVFADMDLSTPIAELSKLLPWYDQGYDVVIGSRGAVRRGFSSIRQIGSIVFRTLRSIMLLSNIVDTQCGFKSSRRQAALDVFPRLQFFKQEQRPKGWKVSAYDVELLYLFDKRGYRIKEVEVEWHHRDESDTKGSSGDLPRYIRESIDMGREVMRVKINQLKGLYDDLQATGH